MGWHATLFSGPAGQWSLGLGFALGLSSLQLGKRAESGYLVCPGLPEFIEDCKEGRRGRWPSLSPGFSGRGINEGISSLTFMSLASSKAKDGPKLPQSSLYSHRHSPWRANDEKINKNEPLTKSRAEASSSQPVHSKAKYSPDAPSGVQEYAAPLASLFLFLPDTQLARS